MPLIKSTSISVHDCVCVPFRGWMVKTHFLNAFEHLCANNCNAAGCFTLNSFPCVSRTVHHPKDIQPTWHNCGKHWSHNWASIPVERFWHLVEYAPTNWGSSEGQKVQLNIRKVFLFCTLSVHHSLSSSSSTVRLSIKYKIYTLKCQLLGFPIVSSYIQAAAHNYNYIWGTSIALTSIAFILLYSRDVGRAWNLVDLLPLRRMLCHWGLQKSVSPNWMKFNWEYALFE